MLSELSETRLDDENFELFAKSAYHNNGCTDASEFEDDIKRIRYVKRQFNYFRDSGDIKILLVLNHLRVFYNVFRPDEVATKILVFRMMEHLDLLKPFLIMIGKLPDKLVNVGFEPVIYGSEMPMNMQLVQLLRDYRIHGRNNNEDED